MDFAYTAGFELTDRFGRLAYRASEMIMKIEHGIQYILHCFASTFEMNLM